MPLLSFQPEGKCKRKAVPLGELFSRGVKKMLVAEQGKHVKYSFEKQNYEVVHRTKT